MFHKHLWNACNLLRSCWATVHAWLCSRHHHHLEHTWTLIYTLTPCLLSLLNIWYTVHGWFFLFLGQQQLYTSVCKNPTHTDTCIHFYSNHHSLFQLTSFKMFQNWVKCMYECAEPFLCGHVKGEQAYSQEQYTAQGPSSLWRSKVCLEAGECWPGLLQCHRYTSCSWTFCPVGLSVQLPVVSEMQCTIPTSLLVLWETLLLP